MKQNLQGNLRWPLIASLAIGLTLFFCAGLQLCFGNLFVVDSNGTIGEYTDSGKALNPSLNQPDGISFFTNLTASATDVFAFDAGSLAVGKYSTKTKIFNPSLITFSGDAGFDIVSGFAASGGSLFVLTDHLDVGSATISQYDATGKLVNPSLITGLGDAFRHGARALVASGDKLYVSFFDGTIGEYTTSGETINATLITGAAPGFVPIDLAVSDDGLRLFISNYDSGTISEYTTSGQLVDSALISGLTRPSTLEVSGSRLFVGILTNPGGDDGPPAGQVAEYTTSGQLVNASFIRNLPPLDLAITRSVQNVPETLSGWWLVASAAGILLFARLRQAR